MLSNIPVSVTFKGFLEFVCGLSVARLAAVMGGCTVFSVSFPCSKSAK